MNRKMTAWKKNRKLGDIYGGRLRIKLDDNIFKRCHSLKPPAATDELPILIQDNPSRDFFFPISADEAREALKALPEQDYGGITHIWCRRLNWTDYRRNDQSMAEFICGSGVRVIVLYPWHKSMVMTWQRKPSNRFVKDLRRLGIEIRPAGKGWKARPTLAQLRSFYVQYLLYHEVGHHVDWYNRHWSKANGKVLEEFADQYAFQKTTTATRVLNLLKAQQTG